MSEPAGDPVVGLGLALVGGGVGVAEAGDCDGAAVELGLGFLPGVC